MLKNVMTILSATSLLGALYIVSYFPVSQEWGTLLVLILSGFFGVLGAIFFLIALFSKSNLEQESTLLSFIKVVLLSALVVVISFFLLHYGVSKPQSESIEQVYMTADHSGYLTASKNSKGDPVFFSEAHNNLIYSVEHLKESSYLYCFLDYLCIAGLLVHFLGRRYLAQKYNILLYLLGLVCVGLLSYGVFVNLVVQWIDRFSYFALQGIF